MSNRQDILARAMKRADEMRSREATVKVEIAAKFKAMTDDELLAFHNEVPLGIFASAYSEDLGNCDVGILKIEEFMARGYESIPIPECSQ